LRWGIAAGAALLLALATWIGLQPVDPARLLQAVAEEVALDHTSALAPDVVASSFAELAGRLERLDFTPRGSNRTSDLVLDGVRYCSIQGQIAAQIQLHDARTGRRVTLHQTRATPRLEALEPAEIEVAGTRVEIWREGGLVLALAQRAGDPAGP